LDNLSVLIFYALQEKSPENIFTDEYSNVLLNTLSKKSIEMASQFGKDEFKISNDNKAENEKKAKEAAEKEKIEEAANKKIEDNQKSLKERFGESYSPKNPNSFDPSGKNFGQSVKKSVSKFFRTI